MVDVSYLVNSFLREGPPWMSMVCYLSSFAESKKHSIRLYVRRRSLTSSPKIPNFWHSSIFLSPRSALQSQIEQKFILIPYQPPPSTRTDSFTLPSAQQCLRHPFLPNHYSTKPTNNPQTPQAKIPLKPIPHTQYQVRRWRPEN